MRKNGYLDADELLERTAPLVDAETGLIAPPAEVLVDWGGADIVIYSSKVSMLPRAQSHITLDLDEYQSMSGSGSSAQREWAQAKSICEALERYCNYSFDERCVINATRNELGDQAVDLRRFAHGARFEYSDDSALPRNDAPIRWVQGYSLTGCRPVYVPFGAVYVSSVYDWQGEGFTQPISTGSAIAASYERACATAIMELIERDTLTLTWLHQLPLPRIDLDESAGPELRERLARARASGIETYFFDATTDLGVPTAYCLQWQEGGDVAMMAMAATRFDIEDALVRVIDEAASSRAAIASLSRRPQPYDPLDFQTFTRLTDGAVYYADAANRAAFDFMLQSPNRIDLATLKQRQGRVPESDHEMLDRLVSRFIELNYELCVVDLTVGPVADCGLYAMRAVAPELLPLNINYNLKYSATPRLFEAPERMGHRAKSYAEFNRWPQPFA